MSRPKDEVYIWSFLTIYSFNTKG